MDHAALFETLAGTGATMVAIIGGFALSKWLSIANDLAGAQHELEDLRTQRDKADEIVDRARDDLDRYDLEDHLRSDGDFAEFVVLAVDATARPDGPPDSQVLKLLRQRNDSPVKRPEIVDPVLTVWLQDARRIVEHRWFERWPMDTEWPRWRDVRDSLPERDGRTILWRKHFDRQAEKAERRAKERREQRPETKSIGALIASYNTMDHLDVLGDYDFSPVGTDTNRAELAAKRSAAEKDASDLRVAEHVAERRAQRMAPPQNTGRTVALLASTFVVTVLPSLAVLAARPDSIPRALLAGVLGAYGLGVGLMFAYMTITATATQRPPDQ